MFPSPEGCEAPGRHGSLPQPGQWAGCAVPQGRGVPWDMLVLAGKLLRSTELSQGWHPSAAMNKAVDPEDFILSTCLQLTGSRDSGTALEIDRKPFIHPNPVFSGRLS